MHVVHTDHNNEPRCRRSSQDSWQLRRGFSELRHRHLPYCVQLGAFFGGIIDGPCKVQRTGMKMSPSLLAAEQE